MGVPRKVSRREFVTTAMSVAAISSLPAPASCRRERSHFARPGNSAGGGRSHR